MSNYARFRDWHLWIGLLMLLPLSVIAVTGFLWNHEQALGLRREPKLPRPKPAHGDHTPSDRAATSFVAAPGNALAWTDWMDAALAVARQEWGEELPLERIELRNDPQYGMVVKVKAPETSAVRPYEIIWSVTTRSVIERKGDPKAGTDWAKIVHDVHTGKFFSKKYGFLWSDGGALAILALTLTGVVLYLIPALKRRSKQRKKMLDTLPVSPRKSHPPSRPVTVVSADDCGE